MESNNVVWLIYLPLQIAIVSTDKYREAPITNWKDKVTRDFYFSFKRE